MVSPVGQNVGFVGTNVTTRPYGSAADALGLSGSDRSGDGRDKALNPFDRDPPQQFRAGFGEGTVSGPAATYIALDRGLTGARRAVPRLEDVQAQQRARREAGADKQQDIEFRRIERRRLEAFAVARRFVNRLDQVAGTTAARLAGEEPAEPAGATIEVGGTSFSFTRGANGTNLDVSA